MQSMAGRSVVSAGPSRTRLPRQGGKLLTAYARLTDALRGIGSDVKESDQSQGKAMAQCPAHDDGKRSLSINPRRDSKGVVLYCHAGCDLTAVLAALSLHERDLFDDNEIRNAYRTRADYKYPDGRVVHRKPDKSFPQSGNTKGNALFRADQVAAAAIVHVVEGEKDVLAIQAVGGTAVCSAMGAGKAQLADWSPLRGKSVVIVADRDGPGRKHATQVAELLRGVAASVCIMEAAAGKDAADHIAAGKTLDELVVPAEEAGPIDGAQVLDEVEASAGRFLAFPSAHHLVVIVLWIAHTWAVSAFYVTPRLVLDSPEPGSGKTRVLEVLALLCPNAKLTISTTTAALYRRIAKASVDDPNAADGGLLFNAELLPTVLQDEADAIFGRTNNPQAEDLRALYNSGYKRGATVDRCEGDAKNMVVREFPVFAPVALAGLAGKMPQTILDRAVVLHMRRRAPDEHLDEFRERDARAEAFPLRERLVGWAWSDWNALRAMRPVMPEGVRDRPAEVWEALLAIADFAGGDWPERARAACRYFVLDTEPDERLSLGLRLLRDIKAALGDLDRMFSADVVTALTSDQESEWRDLWGKPLDQRRLAKELKRYGIESQEVRIGAENRKGYVVAGDTGLAQAWRRYLVSGPMRDKGDKGDIAGQSVADVSRTHPERDIRDTSATPETPSEQQLFGSVADVADVAHIDGPDAANAAYRNGQCRDCGVNPHSAGRTRCDQCHRIQQTVIDGYAR
jgi:5S rRNA maturation endonuclease (ribonuclease M5)